MGYDKTDELAVNTIRTLAVSPTLHPSSSAVAGSLRLKSQWHGRHELIDFV